ncbi:UNVERIFIED_CONTAM: hypothetical protein RMT77_016129 [Armadillidium vulgare]
MEYLYKCKICCKRYNKSNVMPKVLNCGHTFCSQCITKLDNSFCPNCQAPITKKTEFPINYLVFDLINKFDKPEGNLIHDVIFRIDNLKEILKSKLENIKNEISQKSEQQKVMENDLEISTNLNTRDLVEVNGKLFQLENAYEKSYEVPTTENPVRPDYIIATGIYLREKSISDDAFLREIYEGLKESEIFCFKFIENKLKFGKLTVKDNQIFMHSLSLDEIPKDSKTVQFDEMIKAFRGMVFQSFFEITVNNGSFVTKIKLEDAEKVPRFISLCTGENGPSYKNCSYELPRTRNLEDNSTTIFRVNITNSLPVDHPTQNLSSSVTCCPDDIILVEIPNDGFEIRVLFSYSNNSYSIMGRVIDPLGFLDYFICSITPPHKILDCGLVVQL